MNPRRLLMLALGASVSGPATLLRAQTPAASMRRVGVLAPSTHAKEEVILKPFFDEMRLLGWIEGQTVSYDRVFADDQQQDLPRLAAELVARKPELIYAPPMVAALAAKQATGTIPIVFATGTDPVGTGLVASLARPGGNATGVINFIESIVPKRLELVREILPNARRVGILRDPTEPQSNATLRSIGLAAAGLGLTIVWADMSNPGELDAAMAKLTGQGVDVIYASSTIAGNVRAQIVELASRRRVPMFLNRASQLDAGGLFSYGSSLADQLRRSAQLVDKVLRGAKPADLPVEQPTKFELVINLKAAKALGITIPRSALLRADEVIQ
jgi:putative ABC transport system substrate-binding protein